MYELKKFGNVFTSKFVGTGPSSYNKSIYRAAVSQRLRNTVVEHWAAVKCCRPCQSLASHFVSRKLCSPSLASFCLFICSPLPGVSMLPLLLTFWGFQSSADLPAALFGFLSVWPILLHFDAEYIYGFVRWGVCRQSR